MRIISTLMCVWIAGCGGGDPLDSDEDIGGWATATSSLGVFAIGYEPVGYAAGAYQFADPACPSHSDDGTTLTLTGGCAASNSIQWLGSVKVVRGAAGELTLTLSDFGNDALGGETRTSGTIHVTQTAADIHAFSVDVTRKGGIESDITYSGTVRGAFTGPTTWNGSGSVHRSGFTIDGGDVDATTVDEVRDTDVCPGEPLSGTTTMTSDGHTVAITYDGATDCTAAHTAKWTRDGQDMGTVENISCSTGSPSGFGLVAGVLVWSYRRRRKLRRM